MPESTQNKPEPGPEEEEEGRSYAQMVWEKYVGQWENTTSLGVMISFVLLALFTPVFSSNLPFYWRRGGETSYPWFRRLVTAETIDFFYNMSMIAVLGVAVFGGLYWLFLHRNKAWKWVAYGVVGLFSIVLLVVNPYTLLLVFGVVASLGFWTMLDNGEWSRSKLIYWASGTLVLYLGVLMVSFSTVIDIPYGKRYSVYKQQYEGYTVHLKDGETLEGDVIEREDVLAVRLIKSDKTREVPRENVAKVEKNSEKITALFPPLKYGHREEDTPSRLLSPGSYPAPPDALKEKILKKQPELRDRARKNDDVSLKELVMKTETFREYARSRPMTMTPYYLGTDTNGRDILARALYGSRVSLAVGFVATSISLFIGVILGAIAGYFGGMIDIVISRILEVFMMIPRIMLIVALVSFVEQRDLLIFYIMLILGLTRWVGICRLIRGTSLQKREEDYAMAARALGGGNFRIIFRHVLPNAIHPLFVNAPFAIAGGIILEGGLALIGFGAQNYPSWGTILNEALPRLTTHPYLLYVPVVAIFLAVTAFNLIGAGIRDAIDPKMDVGGAR